MRGIALIYAEKKQLVLKATLLGINQKIKASKLIKENPRPTFQLPKS